MLPRFRMLWARVRDSLWLVPSLATLFCAALAAGLIRLERAGLPREWDPDHWLFGGGPEGARGVLTAISGGLITVTGVVFSVTIVALQLASSQFTPRVLRNFTADRSNQVVLGVFIGTFTYTLVVLRTVRGEIGGEPAFVPGLAVAVAVLLALASIGFLIYFIHHAARSIQVSVILDRVTRLTLQQIDLLFPESIERPAGRVPAPAPGTEPATVVADRAGYLQAVDAGALFEAGEVNEIVIRMERHIGEFVLPGQTLVSVWPAGLVTPAVVDAVRRGLVIGPERTPDQDVEFGIIEISDIAVKALSPGINDPTTALHCIDRLGEILLALGTRYPPQDARTREGAVHFIAKHVHFARAVALAFEQVAHFAATNPLVLNKLLEVLRSLEDLVPAARAAPLLEQRRSIVARMTQPPT